MAALSKATVRTLPVGRTSLWQLADAVAMQKLAEQVASRCAGTTQWS
jgi:hypothetical protein